MPRASMAPALHIIGIASNGPLARTAEGVPRSPIGVAQDRTGVPPGDRSLPSQRRYQLDPAGDDAIANNPVQSRSPVNPVFGRIRRVPRPPAITGDAQAGSRA